MKKNNQLIKWMAAILITLTVVVYGMYQTSKTMSIPGASHAPSSDNFFQFLGNFIGIRSHGSSSEENNVSGQNNPAYSQTRNLNSVPQGPATAQKGNSTAVAPGTGNSPGNNSGSGSGNNSSGNSSTNGSGNSSGNSSGNGANNNSGGTADQGTGNNSPANNSGNNPGNGPGNNSGNGANDNSGGTTDQGTGNIGSDTGSGDNGSGTTSGDNGSNNGPGNNNPSNGSGNNGSGNGSVNTSGGSSGNSNSGNSNSGSNSGSFGECIPGCYPGCLPGCDPQCTPPGCLLAGVNQSTLPVINTIPTDTQASQNVTNQDQQNDALATLLAYRQSLVAPVEQQAQASKYQTVDADTIPAPSTNPAPAGIVTQVKARQLSLR